MLDPDISTHEDILIELVELHCKIYGYAEFGAGHVVLSDYNWDSIDFCLEEIQKCRDGKHEHFQDLYDDPEDLYGKDFNATEKLLIYLKEIIK